MQSYWKKDQNTKRSRIITLFCLIFYTIYTILQPSKVTISSAFRTHVVLFPIFKKKHKLHYILVYYRYRFSGRCISQCNYCFVAMVCMCVCPCVICRTSTTAKIWFNISPHSYSHQGRNFQGGFDLIIRPTNITPPIKL